MANSNEQPGKNKTALTAAVTVEKIQAVPVHPHCKLPEHFFEPLKVLHNQPRSILSVTTWKGRNIFSVET